MESNLRRALAISAGDPWVLVSSGIAIGLYIVTILFLVAAVVIAVRKRHVSPAETAGPEELLAD